MLVLVGMSVARCLSLQMLTGVAGTKPLTRFLLG
jgi:hypothetical protein